MLAAVGNLKHPDRGIYRSTDGGGVWVKVSPASDFFGKIMLGINPVSPDTVYASLGFAVGTGTDLFVTTDFGLSWGPRGNRVMTNGWFAHEVVVNPNNPSHVIIGGYDVWSYDASLNQLMQKSDWQKGSFAANAPGTPDGPADYVHQNIHDIVVDPLDPDRMYFATDGGIYVSNDAGQTFRNANGGLQTAQFVPGVSSDPQDSAFFIGGLQNSGIAIYEGTPSWRRAIGGPGGYTAIDPRGGSTIFAGSSFLKTYTSPNQGLSFVDAGVPTQSFNSANFVAPFVMAPGHPERMYFGGSAMYRSENFSGQITEVSNGVLDSGRKVISIAVSYQNKNKLYVSTSPLTQGSLGNIVVTPPARILVSEDGGATYRIISQALPDRMAMDLAVDPRDDDVLYAVMSGFGSSHVYKTTDGGSTWSAVGSGLPDVPFYAIAIDQQKGEHIYIGGDMGAWMSEDQGQNWTYLTGDLGDPFMVTDLSICEANRKLRMATNGRGMMEALLVHPGNPTSVQGEIERLGVTISPNPSRGATATVMLGAHLMEPASVTVLGIDGRLVSSYPHAIHPGIMSFDLKLDDLSAGMYLISVEAGGRRQVLKWVVEME